MERLTLPARAGWREHVEHDLGFVFHTIGGEPYWDETACYRFSVAQIDELEAATGEIEQLCLDLVDEVVRKGAYEALRIPANACAAIERSWNAGDKNLYGRFDFRYDGTSPPKLLEYNADTPTALFEASVVQWDWLEAHWPKRDQFNSLHEKLIEAWRHFGLAGATVYFAAVKGHLEDGGTVDYMRDTAVQAGLATARIDIEDIGWNGQRFVDLEARPIEVLFKLYPWEWAISEAFGQHFLAGTARIIEPAWKMVLSNKAALALLWERAAGHPNLLATSFSPDSIDGAMVRKPIFSREGANLTVVERGEVTHQTDGKYGAEGFVYQSYVPLPAFDGRYPVIGSWVVASQPAGIGIREDATPITRDSSRFVPHFFE